MTPPHPSTPPWQDPADAVAAALDWWREAGIDLAFEDAPRAWFAPAAVAPDATAEEPLRPARTPPPAPRTARDRALEPAASLPMLGGPREGWPDRLENFRDWWMIAPDLGEGALARRLPPEGVRGARLMAVLPQPLATDREVLAEGPPGRFLAAITRAFGMAPHEVYRAALLPAPSALPDWERLGARGLAALFAHHAALAAPERIVLFGRAAAAAFALDPQAARAPFTIEAGGRAIPVLAVPDLAELARAPARRQRLWQTWLDWTR